MGILVNYQVMSISENSKKFRIKKILDFANKSNNFTNIMKTIYLKPSIEKLTTSVPFFKKSRSYSKVHFGKSSKSKCSSKYNLVSLELKGLIS